MYIPYSLVLVICQSLLPLFRRRTTRTVGCLHVFTQADESSRVNRPLPNQDPYGNELERSEARRALSRLDSSQTDLDWGPTSTDVCDD